MHTSASKNNNDKFQHVRNCKCKGQNYIGVIYSELNVYMHTEFAMNKERIIKI